jgi:hypothetical protein
VLADRVAAVRLDLLLVADALKHCLDPDPASVALIRELLTNGCSPLYNANVSAQEPHATLARASAQITVGTAPDASQARHAHHQPRATW